DGLLADSEIRHAAGVHVLLPLVEQRPTHGAGTKVSHGLVLGQPVDGLLDDGIVPVEDGSVRRQQEFSVVGADAFERLNELWDIRPVVRVNDADAAVLVDVVATKEEIAHLETELAGRMARRMPYLQPQVANPDRGALVKLQVDGARGHRNLDALCFDRRVGRNLVTALDRLDAERVRRHLRLEQFLGPCDALNVVGVRVRGDDHLAGGQVEVHPPDQFDDFLDRVEETDVDEHELAAAVDQVNVHSQPPSGLVIHLDDVWEQIT